MSDPKVFLDTETFGLGEAHATFEAAWAYETGDPFSVQFYISPDDLRRADPGALKVNAYEGRGLAYQPGDMFADVKLRRGLAGRRVVASNPDDFDLLNLRRRWGLDRAAKGIPWLHRSINLATYAMGVLGLDDPIGMAALVYLLNEKYGAGIEPEGVHTAVSGVLTTRACYQVLQRLAETPASRESVTVEAG